MKIMPKMHSCFRKLFGPPAIDNLFYGAIVAVAYLIVYPIPDPVIRKSWAICLLLSSGIIFFLKLLWRQLRPRAVRAAGHGFSWSAFGMLLTALLCGLLRIASIQRCIAVALLSFAFLLCAFFINNYRNHE